jgi:hypothetical protein
VVDQGKETKFESGEVKETLSANQIAAIIPQKGLTEKASG